VDTRHADRSWRGRTGAFGILAVAGLAVASLSGCGSSSGGSGPSTSGGAPSTSTQPVSTPSGSTGDAAAIAAVKDAFTKFFQPNTPEKVSLGLLQNGDGKPLLPDAQGYAVNTDGTWQISEYTFCGLLTLEGGAPAECKSPTATQTPQ
jgi:hypothetical protein